LAGWYAANGGIDTSGGIEIALEALEVGTKFGGALAAEVAVLFESFADDAFEFGMNFAIVFGDRLWRFVQNAVEK
jgi:hypothetical protein